MSIILIPCQFWCCTFLVEGTYSSLITLVSTNPLKLSYYIHHIFVHLKQCFNLRVLISFVAINLCKLICALLPNSLQFIDLNARKFEYSFCLYISAFIKLICNQFTMICWWRGTSFWQVPIFIARRHLLPGKPTINISINMVRISYIVINILLSICLLNYD